MKKVAIIGAGAAGMSCAIILKTRMPDLDITVYEAHDRVGKKIAVTGNGRCNISNANASKINYHGDSGLAQKLLTKFDYKMQCDFFRQLGVLIVTEQDGKAYPMSYQASSVVDALRFRLDELKIKLVLNTTIDSVVKSEDGNFLVGSKNNSEIYSVVVIATGGKAGGKISSESGYNLLKKLGHKIEKLSPAIVQVKTETDLVRQLKGIKINGNVTIITSDVQRTEFGEILFCDYGLSGPPVLQVSRFANCENSIIKLDLLPSFDIESLDAELKSRITLHPNRQISELFTGFINKRLGQVICKACNININQPSGCLTDADVKVLSRTIKSFQLKVRGTTGFENAQVTAGGAQTTQFFDDLMSKKVKGLFAAGEILNVDGDCGGYNLAFAWASANAVANGITNYLKR